MHFSFASHDMKRQIYLFFLQFIMKKIISFSRYNENLSHLNTIFVDSLNYKIICRVYLSHNVKEKKNRKKKKEKNSL